MLIIALVASVGFNGLLGSIVVGMILDRFQTIERIQKDPILDKLAELQQKQVEQGTKLRQHDEALHDMTTLSARMFDVQTEIRILNERLRRKGL